ncbi:unnamed protein product [Phytomonas sp. EM1]|nr:unnamed protein product [Phytomonas sp. EM1]|eukprot:CCW59976.1 unnamed protein product [Phytomonas sp. isolate EM1]
MVIRDSVRGEITFEELARRKRTRYDACPPLEKLLADRGVQLTAADHSIDANAGRYHALLPLEAFDDTMYEELTLSEWADRIEENKGLPCRAFYTQVGNGAWFIARAMGCDVAAAHFTVKVDRQKNQDRLPPSLTLILPRICVCFDAENPITFADRFASAYRRRQHAEDVLRAELYVESVPPDEYQTLNPGVQSRIKKLAMGTLALVQAESILETQAVAEEVRIDYCRCMNADLLRNFSKTNHFSHLSFLQDLETKGQVVPTYGVAPPSGDDTRLAKIIESFQRKTFFACTPTPSFVCRQVRECHEKILSRPIFLQGAELENQRPITLINFDEVQTAAVRNSARFLREKWSNVIVSNLREALGNFTKDDEVNLKFIDEDDYRGTKTEHFMRMLNCEMQDTVRHFLKCNIEVFTRFLEDAGNFRLTINSINDVELSEDDYPAPTEPFGWNACVSESFLRKPFYRPAPLFRVSVISDQKIYATPKRLQGLVKPSSQQGTFHEVPSSVYEASRPNSVATSSEGGSAISYSVSIDEIRSIIHGLIKRCLSSHGDFRTVERSLFSFLHDQNFVTLQSLNLSDTFVESCIGRIDRVLDRTAGIMARYLATFRSFQDLADFDVRTYMDEFKERFPRTKGIEEEIKSFMRRQEEIQKNIPAEKDLGMVLVDCLELKVQLSSKCNQVVSGVLTLLANRAVQKEDRIDAKFTELRNILFKPTETPEEVVAAREFIKSIPEQMFDIQAMIEETREIHDLLHLFHHSLSEEEFSKKWHIFGWPSQLDDEINQRTQELQETMRYMTASMHRAQELFATEVESVQRVVQQYYLHSSLPKLNETANDVRSVLEKIQTLRSQANTFNLHESLFNLERTDYSAVHQLSTDFEPYALLWLTIESWHNSMHTWYNIPFTELDAEAIEKQVTENLNAMTRCTCEPRLTPDLIDIAERTLLSIEEFKPLVPTINYLRARGMYDRHWEQISKEIGKDIRPGVTLKSLSDITTLRLQEYDDITMRISEVASREYQIELSLKKMKEHWGALCLNLKPHKETGCFIITKEVADETQETLDEHTFITQSLSFSPFKKLFEEDIQEWEASLRTVQSVLDEWINCQKAWLHLEPIFQSEDISRQIPQEFKRFQQVNKNWTFLTNRAHDINLTMKFCETTDRCLELLRECNTLLELVGRGLNQYLENKRASFARFYFLSDDELLMILSEARDPQKLQPQFRKLFENVAKLDMRGEENEMFGMHSHMDEYIPFHQPVLPRKYVENWLTEVENMMKLSIRMQLEKGLKDFTTMDRKDFVISLPGQIVIAVNQIMWTYECENSLTTHGSLEPYAPKAQENLQLLIETVRHPLSNLQRMNISGLITIEVHARDIVDNLVRDKISSVYDFEWISQLRSYWMNNDYYLRQVEAQFRYGHEYLGNSTRLVITPLTDRIYLTLTGAMHMFLGGAPAGPAGTGKTETVKDLAKAVAKQCVVFNCQEGMTYASMGKFFKGLAQAGAWACFDEFNRIDVEVLSVVAQQVSSLQTAARSKQYRIPFEGTEIVVDPSYAVFITMNPGYAGRTELPDNLKVLFRPVACMVPDYAMIAEIRLFSSGYSDSRKLAQKMVATFRLSSEQLSTQDHYDFGMRAVNTVISAAALMKREYPNEPENELLLRALRNSNAPKFLDTDLLLFNGIVSDLFPGVQVPPVDYGEFMKVLSDKATERHLQPTGVFIRKCIEMYEMIILRHGQMIVGPTMGGKTSATQVLQSAMTTLRKEMRNPRFAEVKTYALNPKAITMSQLYGGFDMVTGEWHDGLVGEIFRTAARDCSDARQWIIFDGPVDALWIESMNTVLDDNKKLCLISGEIIAMTPYMNCWFEVEDLAVASPATVSRAGMIYMEPSTCVGITNLVRSWQMYRLPSTMDPYKEHLQALCEQLFPVLIHFVQTQVAEYSASVWTNLVTSCFNIFAALLVPFTPTRTYEVPQEKLDILKDVYLDFLVFSIVWSFGATGDGVSCRRFDKFLRNELRQRDVAIDLPILDCLQNYEFIPEERSWVAWNDRLPPFTTQVTQANISDIIVLTADQARFKYINRLLLKNSYHTLCCGPTGTGKTVLLQQLLMNEMPKEFTPIFFTFSARTSANQTQDLIFSKFEVRRRASPQIWGAPLNKKIIVFIDDMNMPMKEQYGAQPPIEILRQYMDYHGWYDRLTREFFNIVDVILVGSMGPPGGGRNHVSNRFLRHFNQIAFPDIDDRNLKRIFVTLMDSYFAPFPENIRSKVQTIADASIAVYNQVIKELRPTPVHPHYLFNLRDLSRVISGMANATLQSVPDTFALIRLWLHEEMRTFRDRLINEKDRSWFDQQLQNQVRKHFKVTLEEVIPPSPGASISAISDLLFVDFLGSKNSKIAVYDQVKDYETLVKELEKRFAEYNENYATHKLNIVLFTVAVHHLCRIIRVIRKFNGHVLLLGVGGSGRQSLSRLAAHVTHYNLMEVEISKGYSMNMWQEDMKNVLRSVGLHGKQVLFLFTDTQIVHESMLEDVNNLLNSCEIPNLFVGQEFDDLLNAMKPICIAENLSLDKISMYSRFVRNCRSNLHISLCMSPLGETFRNRLRMFPALVSCCTIDWFEAWPHQALHSVARSFLAPMPLLRGDNAEIVRCAEVCVAIHQSVEKMSQRFLTETRRYNYVTPTSFLEVLKMFSTLMDSQTTADQTNQSRFENGLSKLRETEEAVEKMQQTLAEKQPILIEKSESIKALVQEIEQQTSSAEETKIESQKTREAVAAMQAECATIEQQAQEKLSEALPELDRALETLKNLKSSQITEVAGYKAPTPGVVMTMQGICILFQIKPVLKAVTPMEKKPDYWATAKEQLLNNPNALMQRLINYDKEHIPGKLIQAVRPLVTSEDFTPKKIAGASQACAAMCQWTHAMVRFYEVNLKVEPLRQRLSVAQNANREAQEKLRLAEARLDEVSRCLSEMQARKESAENEMKQLEETVRHTELRLQRAAMLIDGLKGEKKNWTKSLEELRRNSKFLMGDMLAAAGQIVYCGPFTAVYRRELIESWGQMLQREGIPHSKKLSVYYTLQDIVETREWNLNGLPGDKLSVENALFLTYARRWPLIVDPQTQANKWIRQTYKDSLEVLKLSQKDLLKRIEYCIRVGRPVLLENVCEEIDASLGPLLDKQVFTQAGIEMIRITDTAIPWNPKFKFFMTTKWSNPHYIPEVVMRVTLLNFFITPQGLEDQLLGVVVGQERKELETRRSDLIQKNAAMKADLVHIQKTILRKMEEVQGDMLDDVELIEYLNESKEKTAEIVAKVAEAEEAEISINASREEYRPIARHSSCLYFCCSNLSNVDPMYQYSLQWFVQLFIAGIEQAAAADEIEKRLFNLKDYFTYSFYQNISRSLFEKHKLMFSFYLCLSILRQSGLIVEEELRFLLHGPSMIEAPSEANPDPGWLAPTAWSELCYLGNHFTAFRDFVRDLVKNPGHYYEVLFSSNAEYESFYSSWGEGLTRLQRMMVLRCLRPDKLGDAVHNFVVSTMGDRFIRPPPFDLFVSFKDSTAATPLIFVLSQGADPYGDWKRFAETQGMGKKLYDISLGQGQGPRAERMLQEAMESGAWVLLQNCHLAISWMPTLESIVESMPMSIIHPNFRLWLTSMPNPHFPVSVLENGVKMTNEPPKGMQANVTRSLLAYSNDYLESCRKPNELKKLFFSMCFFHALIQERRKFGPLGWNIPYEYTSGDLGCCVEQIKMFLDKYDDLPYKVIRELSGNIHYGGRVTDNWDRRTLNTLLEHFVTPDLIQDGYQFSPLPYYQSIAVTNQKGYIEYVASWPINTHPEVFGLHENADIACARSETFETLAAIAQLEGEHTTGGINSMTPDEQVAELAGVIKEKLCQPFDINKFRSKYPTKYEDSMNTVLVQEAIRFNPLLTIIHQTLDTLPLAMKGEVVMSKELEDVYRSIYNNQVPTQWAERAYPSLKTLAAWIDDLVLRLAMIQDWYDNGHPKIYWISGFFFPQAFLTGIFQNFARQEQVSIDTISYSFEWKREEPSEITSPPPIGCYVHGIFMEGARIDPETMTLAELKPKVLFEPVPLLWLKPIINRAKPPEGTVYECPLYKTVSRAGTLSTTGHSTNFVLAIEVPTTVDPKHWVRRGVAMLCALSM